MSVIHEPERDFVRRNCDWLGIPVTGSSLALRSLIDHEGVMRRSAETSGFADESDGSEGTVIKRGISLGVARDIVEGSSFIQGLDFHPVNLW